MGQFVVIVKQMKDARTDANAAYPDAWPAECEEFETLEDARAKYPDQPVLAVAEYNHFKRGLDMAEQYIPKPADSVPNPSWAFWRSST